MEMIEAARSVTNHPIPAVFSERRPGDPSRLIASSKKAQEELGWKPRLTKVEDIIESAWKWHKNNPEGFAK
jgi:UDP-glucose 4-epimerase